MNTTNCRPCALVLLLAFAACSEEGEAAPADGEVTLDVEAVDLGAAFVGETRRLTVRVKNRGRTAGAVNVEAMPPFEAKAPAGDLAPGDVATLEVSFTPADPGPAFGELKVSIAGVPGTAALPLEGEGATRTIEVSEVVDIGVIEVGRTVKAELRVKNTAPLPQVVTTSVDGPDAGDVELEARSVPLDAGEERRVGVTVTPSSDDALVARLRVKACETCEEKTVLLSGRGWAPSVAATPSSLDLGTVPPGSSLRAEVRLQNTSPGPVPVTAVQLVAGASSPFTLDAVELPLLLDPGALPLGITFAPVRQGPFTATLRMVAAGQLLEVPVRGNGGQGNVLVAPASVDFGLVASAIGATRRVDVSDTGVGDAPVVRAVRFEGPDAARFVARTSRTLPTSIRGDSLGVDVDASTSEPGTFSAELVIEVEGKASRRVPLTSTVVTGGYCELQIEPPVIAFGLQPYGQMVERQLVLRNNASRECTVGPFSLEGSAAFSVNVSSQTRLVPARGFINVAVRYTPERGGGADVATLSFGVASATTPSASVALSGRGSEAVLAASPAALEFPAGSIGGEDLLAVTLRNASPVPLRIEDQRISGTTDRFAILQEAPAAVPVGGEVTVHVRHRAADVRASGNLEVAVAGASAPIVLPLSAPAATANCGAGCPTPRVSCPADLEVPLQRDVAITGGASTTLAGEVSCTWAITSAPEGSAAAAPAEGCDSIFRADLPGSYELALTAHAPGDRTATCSTTVAVEPSPGLWFESRGPDRVPLLQHVFLDSAGALDAPATWTASTGHAWRSRVRPAWGADGLGDDPIVEAGGGAVAHVIRLEQPQVGVAYEIAVQRTSSSPSDAAEVDSTIWCGGTPVVQLLTSLPPVTAAHLGTVSFTGPDTCNFTASDFTIVLDP